MNKTRNKKLLIAFGKQLRLKRIEKGFTQKELANEMDVEISQISRIERGQVNTTISTLANICDVLEIQISELFNF